MDFRNNVLYNWEANNIYGGEGGIYNLVNNYYKPGIMDSQDNLKPSDAGANWSAWPALTEETLHIDSDDDGMPDLWERFGVTPTYYRTEEIRQVRFLRPKII